MEKMTANEAVNKMIAAEMEFGAAGDKCAQRVICSERMKLQSALGVRGVSREEKMALVGSQKAEALRVMGMWGVL